MLLGYIPSVPCGGLLGPQMRPFVEKAFPS